MKHSFDVRLHFLMWLWYLRYRELPTQKAIGEAAGRTDPAVGAWLKAGSKPPLDPEVQKGLAAFFHVERAWLFEEAGDPPASQLWAVWSAARTPAKKMPAFTKAGTNEGKRRKEG